MLRRKLCVASDSLGQGGTARAWSGHLNRYKNRHTVVLRP
jgi:hypothetical protein